MWYFSFPWQIIYRVHLWLTWNLHVTYYNYHWNTAYQHSFTQYCLVWLTHPVIHSNNLVQNHFPCQCFCSFLGHTNPPETHYGPHHWCPYKKILWRMWTYQSPCKILLEKFLPFLSPQIRQQIHQYNLKNGDASKLPPTNPPLFPPPHWYPVNNINTRSQPENLQLFQNPARPLTPLAVHQKSHPLLFNKKIYRKSSQHWKT